MGERASRIPRHPSNRSFIEQMLKWGWEVGKTDGTWQSMFSPPINNKQVRVRVKPATQHDANPTTVFMEVYRLTSNGDGELFWRGPSQMWLEMLSMEKAKAEKAKRDDYEESIAKAARRAEAQAAAEVKPLVLAPEPTKEVQVPKMRNPLPGTRVAARDVLEVLTAHDGPVTVRTIGAEMGLDMNKDINVRDVSNRCSYLTGRGLAERVMNGSYRVSNQGKTIDARVQHDGIHEQQPKPIPALALAGTPASAPVFRVVESIDDSIEAVLDLLLPQGFKASHLRFIAPWIESTRRMVEEVSKG